MSIEQFVGIILAIISYIQWNYDDIRFVIDQHTWIKGIFITHWNSSHLVYMSLHLDTLSWFRANLSLLLLLKAACLVEKQLIPIWSSLVWPDRNSHPWSTALETSMLTITLQMRFQSKRVILALIICKFFDIQILITPLVS